LDLSVIYDIVYTLLMKLIEKEEARTLRKRGYSINQIIKETGFSKASISLWVRDIVLTNNQKKKISERGRSVESIEKRRINRLNNEKIKRQTIIDNAKKDFTNISLEQLKLIGIILYLGEGGKTRRGMVRLANSDPVVIKIMMKFLRNVCNVSEDRFRASIHTFTHVDVEKTEKYWSDISGIPRNQFFKTYVKPSSASLQKRNTLPFGTFDIYVCDTKLFLTIMGWIEKIKELTL
jgi:predicted transcriptional regulator